MKLFFRIVAIYLALSFAATAVMRDLTLDLLIEVGVATYAFGTQVFAAAVWLLPVFLVIPFLMGWRNFVRTLPLAGYAAFGTVLLQTGFSFLKSTLPMIVPFYADPWLAEFDRWLHGGHDPWLLAHQWARNLPMERIVPAYIWLWAVPAIALVLIIAVTDRDRERSARFVALYLACWLVLGNLFALMGSSAGPVYYDALLGGDRFEGLREVLATSGVTGSRLGMAQGFLWQAYAERNMALGSGISAFPSVHVGIATVTALYLAERSRWLMPPGVAFLATILFLSVYTGYHYAVDGYFSLLFIAGLWLALRRWPLCQLSLRAIILRPALPAYTADLPSGLR